MLDTLHHFKHRIKPGSMLNRGLAGKRISVIDYKLLYCQVVFDQDTFAVGVRDTILQKRLCLFKSVYALASVRQLLLRQCCIKWLRDTAARANFLDWIAHSLL